MDGSRFRPPLGALLACLTLAFATPAAAAPSAAQRWPVDGPAFATARQIADQHWSMNPCGGDVDISWGKLPADENAESMWTNQFQDYGDAKDNSLCSVTFNVRQDWDWGKLCTIFVHEFGHLAGNAHSSDAHDVMFAYYIGTDVPECDAVSPAGSRAPTAPRRGHRTPAKRRASRSKAYRASTTRHPRRTGSRTRQR
jgi:Matrixin